MIRPDEFRPLQALLPKSDTAVFSFAQDNEIPDGQADPFSLTEVVADAVELYNRAVPKTVKFLGNAAVNYQILRMHIEDSLAEAANFLSSEADYAGKLWNESGTNRVQRGLSLVSGALHYAFHMRSEGKKPRKPKLEPMQVAGTETEARAAGT